MVNERIKNNQKDAVMDTYIRLFLEEKEESVLETELSALKEIMEEKEKTSKTVPKTNQKFPKRIMVGTMSVPEITVENARGFREIKRVFSNGENKIQIPVILDMQKSIHLFFDCNEGNASVARNFMHSIMWSFLSEIPVSKINISVFDCERRGGSVSPFLELKKHVPHVFDGEIHTDAEDIRNRMKQFNAIVDERIQFKLGSKYESIADYNSRNPMRTELVHLLVVNDFPSGFDAESMELLLKILKNGSKCGIYTLIHYNRDISAGRDETTEEYTEQIKKLSSVFEVKYNGCYHASSMLPVEGCAQMTVSEADRFVEEYVERTDELKNRGTVFSDIMDYEMFSSSAGSCIEIPVGLGHDGEIIRVTLGKEPAQHAWIGGNGKNHLLRTIIMGAMLRYSPREMNVYIMDFKGNTGFEEYSTYRLPHMQLLSKDTTQQFAEEVLAKLIEEMAQRSDRFKEAEVTKLGEYVNKTGKTMPRILVIMDEFPSLLNEENMDKIVSGYMEFLKKIISEGGNLGIHLIMATCSVKEMADLGLSDDTMNQVKVRIGLQCKEDAEILFLNKADHALECMKKSDKTAVLNTDCSQKENQDFRVVDCDEKLQKELLALMEEQFLTTEYNRLTFEDNRVTELQDECVQTETALEQDGEEEGTSLNATEQEASEMYEIGLQYETGQGVERNYEEAAKWYERAAGAGNAMAMNNLGVFYNIGQGVEQSFSEAAKWYQKAADAGNAIAMKNLGVLYKQGQGVVQNYEEAAKWYKKAADAGVASAMNNIGVLYDKGQGVEQNYQEAAKWYEKAANAGVPDAMNNLGALYENGQGVEQNYEEAAKWYEKAADAGIQDAMFNLAELYKNGTGIGQNTPEAMKWYEKAAGAGNAFAEKRLSELQEEEQKKKSFAKKGIIAIVAIFILLAIVLLVFVL